MHFDKLIRTFVRADNAHEHRDPGIRMGDSPVMLSLVLSEANGAAKHLTAHHDSKVQPCHPERSEGSA
jgi:hypothetical protein